MQNILEAQKIVLQDMQSNSACHAMSSLLSVTCIHACCCKKYRTASNVDWPLIKVVTPRNIANDLLRNLMIKTLIDYL